MSTKRRTVKSLSQKVKISSVPFWFIHYLCGIIQWFCCFLFCMSLCVVPNSKLLIKSDILRCFIGQKFICLVLHLLYPSVPNLLQRFTFLESKEILSALFWKLSCRCDGSAKKRRKWWAIIDIATGNRLSCHSSKQRIFSVLYGKFKSAVHTWFSHQSLLAIKHPLVFNKLRSNYGDWGNFTGGSALTCLGVEDTKGQFPGMK